MKDQVGLGQGSACLMRLADGLALLVVGEEEYNRQLTRGALGRVESKAHPSVPLTAVVVTAMGMVEVVVVSYCGSGDGRVRRSGGGGGFMLELDYARPEQISLGSG